MSARPFLETIEARAAAAPGDVAVRAVDGSLTYEQLWDRSGRVAAALRRHGTGPVVGVASARTSRMVVALLGVLRSGSACLPLDPGYPPPRLHAMVEDAGVSTVVGDAAVHEVLPGATTSPLDPGLLLAVGPDGRGSTAAEPGIAYIAFTSGSTGRPKGVRYPAAGLDELLARTVADSVVGAGGRTLALTPLSFDVALQEILSTLCAGGTLVCATEEERLDPELLWDLIERERVERVFVTMVALQALAMAGCDRDLASASLREIVAGGERLRIDDDVRELCAALPACDLVNQWGTVEVLIATDHRLTGDPARWPTFPPIGRPLPFVRVDVEDDAGRPAGPGEVGELVVRGPGVAHGYLGGAGPGGFVREGDGTAYRTGDLGRADEIGTVECLGRRDAQIKVRGHRVEPAEVEHALTGRADIVEAAVWLDDRDGDALLCAALVPVAAPPSREELLADLGRVLPHYMLPTRVEFRGGLPRTPSGKLDRGAIAAPEGAR